jgi:hypothetical protein
MIFIAHRGNLHGSNPNLENDPAYIDTALAAGFFAEIDIRKHSEKDLFFAGHDNRQYDLSLSWLEKRKQKLFIHAKDISTLSYFISRSDCREWNAFWHQKDEYTLTTSGLIWAYPGSSIDLNCICVMPELVEYHKRDLEQCFGICSDNVASLRRELSF